MKLYLVVLLGLLVVGTLAKTKINVKELKCLVCETMMDELKTAISRLDPDIKVDVGSYRIDSDGNLQKKRVSQSKSETQLSEIADTLCDKMEDYVRATYKSNGQLMLLRMIGPNGGMNPDMAIVDIIQDDDLNKSLKYYCEGVFEEYEDVIIKHFVESSDNIPIRVCSMEAKLCKTKLPLDKKEL